MAEQNNEFIWGDKWSIEKSGGWFVAGNVNILFCVDLESNYYQIVEKIPDGKKGFRLNSNCIKCEDVVFCMPDTGEYIWCYDLSVSMFSKIEIINPKYVRLGIGDFWKCGEVLWAVSSGLKQIIEINIKERTVIGYYNISEQEKEEIGQSIISGEIIYIVSALGNRIFEFNTVSKEIKVNEVSSITGGLRTITEYDGRFWLSGYKKEIYVWEKEKDKIKILDNFPHGFGIYDFDKKLGPLLDCEATEYNDFTFLTSMLVGDYIWFIPFRTNQILFVNKKTNEINVFEIEEEKEDRNSISSRELIGKYILQYVYEGRYIGLYSIKNEIILEIDVKNLDIKKRSIILSDKNLNKLFPDMVLRESISPERTLYYKLMKKKMRRKAKQENVGMRVYTHM